MTALTTRPRTKLKVGDTVKLTSRARRGMHLGGLAARGGRVMYANGRFVVVRFHHIRIGLPSSALRRV